MNEREILKTIEKLNLTENEAKCYIALFKKDSLTASETSKISGVPRQNTYKALDKLLIKGLVVSIPGNIKLYSASDPRFLKDRALIEFKNSVENDLQELEEKKKEISKREFHLGEDIAVVIKELGTLYKNSRGNDNPLDYVEILKSKDQIHRRKIQLCNEAKSEILGFSKPPFATVGKKLIKELDNAFTEALQRGVKLKSIHQLPTKKSELDDLLRFINKQYEPEYEEVRLSKNLPMKIGIFDDKTVLITLEYPILGELALTSLVIKHQAMAESQKEMFEAYWKKGIDYYMLDGRKYYLDKDKALKDMQDKKNNKYVD